MHRIILRHFNRPFIVIQNDRNFYGSLDCAVIYVAPICIAAVNNIIAAKFNVAARISCFEIFCQVYFSHASILNSDSWHASILRLHLYRFAYICPPISSTCVVDRDSISQLVTQSVGHVDLCSQEPYLFGGIYVSFDSDIHGTKFVMSWNVRPKQSVGIWAILIIRDAFEDRKSQIGICLGSKYVKVEDEGLFLIILTGILVHAS